MAEPIYGTPAQWEIDLGSFTDPNTRLLLEIYNQLYNSNTGDMQQFNAVTSGQTYQSDLLIGKNPALINVYYNSQLLNNSQGADPQYSFDGATGTITFSFEVTPGIQLLIQYSA